ncbi:hypothetical protein BGX27_000649 [Mortierella sp. AM989]|nr:hypothetical protein BGX27_000649 [Mortierella sp. AM989]
MSESEPFKGLTNQTNAVNPTKRKRDDAGQDFGPRKSSMQQKKNEADKSRNNSYKPANKLVTQAGNSAVNGKKDESVANPHELPGEPVVDVDNPPINSIHPGFVNDEDERLTIDSVKLEDESVDPITRHIVDWNWATYEQRGGVR